MHKALAFIGSVMALTMLFFSIDAEITGTVTLQPTVTDHAWTDYEEYVAVVDGREYFYRYDGAWYESENYLDWQERADMGTTLWSGLWYLRSYHARIYHDDKEVVSIEEHVWG